MHTFILGYDSSVIEVAYRRQTHLEAPSSVLSLLPEAPFRVVLDGFFRVNTDFTAIESLYWNDESLRIRRGTWFIQPENIPLPAEQADKIERKHAYVNKNKKR